MHLGLQCSLPYGTLREPDGVYLTVAVHQSVVIFTHICLSSYYPTVHRETRLSHYDTLVHVS